MALAISEAKYGKLLGEALPKVIDSQKELGRCVAMMEALDRRVEEGGRLELEEKALLALLDQLVKAYDDQIELPQVSPSEMVKYLMEARGLRQVDLLEIFGSRSVVSDVISGKREPSKAHIRNLAEFFHVSPAVFL